MKRNGGAGDAGAVHQNVDAADLLDGFLHGFFDGGVIGNIDLDAAVEIPDGDLAAFGRNAFGDGLADARGAARYNCPPACKSHDLIFQLFIF